MFTGWAGGSRGRFGEEMVNPCRWKSFIDYLFLSGKSLKKFESSLLLRYHDLTSNQVVGPPNPLAQTTKLSKYEGLSFVAFRCFCGFFRVLCSLCVHRFSRFKWLLVRCRICWNYTALILAILDLNTTYKIIHCKCSSLLKRSFRAHLTFFRGACGDNAAWAKKRVTESTQRMSLRLNLVVNSGAYI